MINRVWPHIGASPDRIISCSCGIGVLEVKYPYYHRGADIQSAADDHNFCLIDVSGKLSHMHMSTSIKYNASFMCVMLPMEIFVCVHLQWMKSKVHI